MAAATAVTAPTLPETEAVIDGKIRSLRRFNGVMGGVHLVQAVLMLVLSTAFALPVMTYFLQMDSATGRLVHITASDPQARLSEPPVPRTCSAESGRVTISTIGTGCR